MKMAKQNTCDLIIKDKILQVKTRQTMCHFQAQMLLFSLSFPVLFVGNDVLSHFKFVLIFVVPVGLFLEISA